MAAGDNADLLGGRAAQVDHPSAAEGAAIVDPHHHLLPVARIGDPHQAAEGQSGVRGGERELVKTLAAGGAAAMETVGRSEERRVGKEWVSTGRFRWSPYH